MTAAIAFDLFLDEYQAEIDQKENSTTFPMGYIITENDIKHWTNSNNGLAVVNGGGVFSKIKSYKNKGYRNENLKNEIPEIKTVKMEGSYFENQNSKKENYIFVKFTNQKFKNENANLEKEMTKAYMKLLS